MNRAETELLLKRLRKPIENWDRVSKRIFDISNSDHCSTELWNALHALPSSVCSEVWRKPEKINLLKGTVIDLMKIIPTYKAEKVERVVNGWAAPCPEDRIDLVVDPDAVLSYIALRENGLKIKYASRWPVSLLVTTKVLRLPLVQSVLGSNLTKSEKLRELNQVLRRRRLPTLATTKEWRDES